MNGRSVTIAAGLLLGGAAAFAEEACREQSLGAGVKLEEATPIAAIVARPDDYLGKAVRIEGEVTAVCARRGCWLELAADGGAALRVKVDDGEIVFPVAAKGKRAAAEGVVEAIEMDRTRYARFRRHEAEETGAAFDESALGDGPFRIVRLAGTGARVCL
jgi:hypothetical protein